MIRALAVAVVCGVLVAPAFAQDRETKVRNDKRDVLDEGYWIYNDLKTAFETARVTNKPVLVLLRCIPCENCQGFDRELMQRGELVRDLLEKFVCVRIIKANGLDLQRFQYDYDLSSAAFFLNADGTIYGRYGTRTAHRDGDGDVSLEGFAEALKRTLAFHKDFPLLRAGLQAKQADYEGPATPEKFPTLANYKTELDYEGKVVQSCIHCHQVREAQRALVRERGQLIPDDLLYPYPHPAGYGLKLDVKQCATLAEVTPGSIAEKSGFKAGDEILELGGQRLLSIADVQWVLHNLPVNDEAQAVPALVQRKGQPLNLTLALPSGWRKLQDISWRPTTWDLRRIALGGLQLVDATDEERAQLELPSDALALRVKHLGQYGKHAIAKQAGFQKEDVLIEFAGLKGRQGETGAIALALTRPAGEKLAVTVLRGGKRVPLQLPLQ